MQKFTTTAPIAAVVAIPAGRVQFIAADRADTTVEVRPADASKARDAKAAEQTTVDFADGVLRIETTVKHQILGASGSVEVTVQLPAGSTVTTSAASADFRGVGRLGDVTFEGAHGEIKVDEAAGLHLTTEAGDVTIGRLTGDASITTRKGTISIAEAAGGALVLRTSAGDVSVTAAAGVSASLDAGTSYGRVRNSLVSAGAPTLTIKATTELGDINARSL
ncbi:DUF4097 family beta strand repeat-containing protein [Amycolatopsis rhabdoformis]|uniref:DUF4097 family beta strand repeat-containing protein n=1 Tax=Amycolatopsis rhabdoformis TaxID=1448059 RepID=A0ABZ1I364_9PSEU|nr:DUF4097 family beta strand repeat-containing protein [Amycolatopsis rhabdoformis]WSE28844.1 DUF4097 family beta strand repeat-containing protein [Amycolatopsis rhabdoformis]